MGNTPQEKIDKWLEAAGFKDTTNKGMIARIRIAGEFLEKTGRLSEKKACECLTGIDFHSAVDVVKLPNKVYVQYKKKHLGPWFTDTGLMPDYIGLAEHPTRIRTLYKPVGSVPALKSKARSIRDTWTIPYLFKLTKAEKMKFGVKTKGGGVQYIVFDKSHMKEV